MILLAVRYVQNVRHPGGDDTKTTPENKRLQHQWKNKEWGGGNAAGCKGLQILCNPLPWRSIYSLPRGHPSTLPARRLQRRRLVFPREHGGRPRAGGVELPTARAAAGDRAALWIDRQQTTATENPPRSA